MNEVWTIRRVVDWAARDFAERGIDSPKLDAELLVAHALELTRVKLYLDLDRPLVQTDLDAIRGLVQRRRRREPVAYILGRRDFHGATFEVDDRVLIPRPDTEILVERVLAALPADRPTRVLDLCTGSGAIALSVLRLRPLAQAVGTDLSDAALEVARANAARLQVHDRFEPRSGDLFSALAPDARFDVVCSNPPYVVSSEIATLMPEVAKFEPSMALDGGPDGLAFYRRLVDGSPARLEPGGLAAFEVGAGQAADVAAMFEASGAFEGVRITRDYGAVERVVEARLRPR